MNKNNINYVVHRTKEGTVVEMTCGVLMLLSLVLCLAVMGRVPDGAGMLVQTLVFAFVVALMLVLAYCPKSFNVPDNSPARLYAAVVRFLRILSVLLALLSLGINVSTLFGVSHVVALIAFGVLFLPALYWIIVEQLRASIKPKK